MELIVFVAALLCVGVLAMRFGYDSRMPAPSKEYDMANFGLSWQDQPGTTAGDPSREAALFPRGPSTQNARPRLVMPQPFFGVLRNWLGERFLIPVAAETLCRLGGGAARHGAAVITGESVTNLREATTVFSDPAAPRADGI